MSKPVLITASVLMVLLVGLVKRDGTPINFVDTVNVFGMKVRMSVKVEVNPDRRPWLLREPGLACVAAPPDSTASQGGGQ